MSRSKAVIASYVGVVIYAALVFLGAWRFDYWQGGLYLALALLGVTISHLLAPRQSDLARRRMRDAPSGERWDKQLLGLFFLLNVVMFLVAGMDSGRFHWSAAVPPWVSSAGAGVMIIGQILFALARRENAFFSSTVQIQQEAGHQVCQTGPYRWVRHPGYLGMLLSVAAFPFVMGSCWAGLPAALAIAILVLRTRLEDRFLLAALPGYADYAAATRFRLLPGVF